MAEYAVTFADSQMSFWDATDIDDLLLLVAEYRGGRKEIEKRALYGCHTISEKIEMHNALALFSDNKIERVREIKERIYG